MRVSIILSAILLLGMASGAYAQPDLETSKRKGWKKYQNNSQGFELTYPPHFYPDKNRNFPASGNVIVAFRRPSYGDWSISIAGPLSESHFDGPANIVTTYETYDEAVARSQQRSDVNQKTIVVAGLNSQEISYIEKAGKHEKKAPPLEHIEIVVPDKNNGYLSIEWKSRERISDNKTVKNSKEEFYAIVSSIRFFDAKK